MTKKEFQKLHEFTDDDMLIIDTLIKLFVGKIVHIEDSRKK